MRHTATCIFSYVDPDVVINFGFLPQDMLGKSVFDFYHPEDMPFLKEIYKSGKYLPDQLTETKETSLLS